MTDKPILFSGPMVRALLDGTKYQTRRVLKPDWNTGANPAFSGWRAEQIGPRKWQILNNCVGAIATTQYAVGDRLWVRETWQSRGLNWGKKISDMIPGCGPMHYAATDQGEWHDYWGGWKPSIHMPRWASRLMLTVTDVRVQRLQEISEADAVAEGCKGFVSRDGEDGESPREEFRALWDGLNADRGFGWDQNPWVAAYTFTVHKCNIDKMGGAA